MSTELRVIVQDAFEELNEELEKPISYADDLRLLGTEGALDSLSFVSLMVIIEEKLFDTYEKQVTIVDDKAFSRRQNPFENIDSLIEYLKEKLGS